MWYFFDAVIMAAILAWLFGGCRSGGERRGRKAGGLPFGPGPGPQGKKTLPYEELIALVFLELL